MAQTLKAAPDEMDTPHQTTPAKRKPDAFPSTQRTWLGDQLCRGEDGRLAACQHIMQVYAEPLGVYFKGSGFRSMGDASDHVNGFFADRLSRTDFLDRWQESGRPMRYWLIVGFKHFLYEEGRRQRRGETPIENPDLHAAASDDRQFDRACARALVAEALASARSACAKSGLETHFDLFEAHFVHSRAYADLEQEYGIEPKRAKVMVRTATGRFREALRQAVAWRQASDEQVDSDIADLMEALEL